MLPDFRLSAVGQGLRCQGPGQRDVSIILDAQISADYAITRSSNDLGSASAVSSNSSTYI